MEVKEGSNAKLQCTVTAEPKPNIEWFKKGVRMKENRRVKFESDGDSFSVTIRDARSFDEGEYKCVATNEIDSASCAATLTVRVVAKPEFKDKLKRVEVMEGDSAQFDTRVVGYPVPELQWFKGISKLKSERRIEFKENSEDNMFSLEIRDTQRDDAGMYKCEASNEGGKVFFFSVMFSFKILRTSVRVCLKSVLTSDWRQRFRAFVLVTEMYALLCMHLHL